MFRICIAFVTLVVIVHASQPWVAEPRDDKWLTKHQSLVQQTTKHAKDVKIVFLGDSITEGWNYSGLKLFQTHYTPRHAFNYGVSGDRTEHVLWRLQHNELAQVHAKVVVLMIGTNNIGSHKPADIAKGVHAILDDLHHRMPHAKVLLLSILPRASPEIDSLVHEVNNLIKHYADHKRVHWLDLTHSFEKSLGNEIETLFISDHVHLSPKGYEMWYKKMEVPLAHLLSGK